jgi:hypothetical protein
MFQKIIPFVYLIDNYPTGNVSCESSAKSIGNLVTDSITSTSLLWADGSFAPVLNELAAAFPLRATRKTSHKEPSRILNAFLKDPIILAKKRTNSVNDNVEMPRRKAQHGLQIFESGVNYHFSPGTFVAICDPYRVVTNE